MAKYRKRSVTIDAIQFTGTGESCTAVTDFLGGCHSGNHRWMSHTNDGGWIVTLEGDMRFAPGDWIIRGVAGEYYPCRDDIFQATYREAHDTDPNSDFSLALIWCRAGARIYRRGWNGKNMFVVYQAGYPDGIGINANTAEATGIKQGTICRFSPYLMMRTADGSFVPWVASQTDLLADDWCSIQPTTPPVLCAVEGRSPDGGLLECTLATGHGGKHCDGSRDSMWWADGEVASV